MITRKIIIGSLVGLHARPASVFSKTAKKYESTVKVKFNKREVNGKSALQLITLKAIHGVEVIVIVDGPDEETAITPLCKILETNFDTE